jgi:glycosyltransferase involved in cell wall biosynthesis
MKLVAMLRIKDAILTIEDCLNKLSNLVDAIVIVDNGSTDGTLAVYKKFPKIKLIKKTKGFNEGRDKCLAHELAKSLNPDWIIWLDADEVFEKSVTRKDLEKYMTDSKLNLVKFRIFNFWLSKKYYRTDGIWLRYTSQPQRQIWRNIPKAYFRNIPFHNGGIMGIEKGIITSHLRLKHYGYIDQKQIKTREQIYNDLKNDAMSKKTLPTNQNNLKLNKWIEFTNSSVNRVWQYFQKAYWDIIEIRYKFHI